MVPTNKLGPQLYMYTASFLAGVRNGATPGVWTPAEILEANPTEGTAEPEPEYLAEQRAVVAFAGLGVETWPAPPPTRPDDGGLHPAFTQRNR